jgi:hypothetical protein
MKRKAKQAAKSPNGDRVRLFVPLGLSGGRIEKGKDGPVVRNPTFSARFSLSEAFHNTSDVFDTHKKMFESGDEGAIKRLLTKYPFFFSHPWIREQIYTMVLNGKSFKNRRGREKGSGLFDVMHIRSLVEICVKHQGINKERAFKYLRDLGIGLTYDRIKELYYAAETDSRRKSLLIFYDKYEKAKNANNIKR